MVRLLTFQSKEVIEILLRDKYYEANTNLMREGNICEEDINNCFGKIPIWVFQHPLFEKPADIGYRQWCDLLFKFKCEMSIDSLDGFYAIELLVDEQPPMGIAHNASILARVIPYIDIKQVQAVYFITKTNHFYFYKINVMLKNSNEIFFKEPIEFLLDMYEEDHRKLPKLNNTQGVPALMNQDMKIF